MPLPHPLTQRVYKYLRAQGDGKVVSAKQIYSLAIAAGYSRDDYYHAKRELQTRDELLDIAYGNFAKKGEPDNWGFCWYDLEKGYRDELARSFKWFESL